MVVTGHPSVSLCSLVLFPVVCKALQWEKVGLSHAVLLACIYYCISYICISMDKVNLWE